MVPTPWGPHSSSTAFYRSSLSCLTSAPSLSLLRQPSVSEIFHLPEREQVRTCVKANTARTSLGVIPRAVKVNWPSKRSLYTG